MMGLNFILWALLLAHSFQRTSCTHNRYRILKTRTTTSPTNIPDSSPVCRGASVKSTLKCCIIFICVTNVIKTHRATCWRSWRRLGQPGQTSMPTVRCPTPWAQHRHVSGFRCLPAQQGQCCKVQGLRQSTPEGKPASPYLAQTVPSGVLAH